MINKEMVTKVTHWSDRTFSFTTTRKFPNRFNNGEFAMVGLVHEGKKLMRAYSFASANHEDHLEFFSIKIKDGPLTSQLQYVQVGDEILVNSKSTGALLIDRLKPGRTLYLIATGTGLAPFMSIIKDLEVYDKFNKVILTHTVQKPEELVYREYLENFNKQSNYITKGNFIYFNTLTQAVWPRTGRITTWIIQNKLQIVDDKIDYKLDRFMVCGSQGLNRDMITHFKSNEMIEGNSQISGDFVIEKAFVQR